MNGSGSSISISGNRGFETVHNDYINHVQLLPSYRTNTLSFLSTSVDGTLKLTTCNNSINSGNEESRGILNDMYPLIGLDSIHAYNGVDSPLLCVTGGLGKSLHVILLNSIQCNDSNNNNNDQELDWNVCDMIQIPNGKPIYTIKLRTSFLQHDSHVEIINNPTMNRNWNWNNQTQ